jgi:ATP-dependent protease Clp ATPase subunit
VSIVRFRAPLQQALLKLRTVVNVPPKDVSTQTKKFVEVNTQNILLSPVVLLTESKNYF